MSAKSEKPETYRESKKTKCLSLSDAGRPCKQDVEPQSRKGERTPLNKTR